MRIDFFEEYPTPETLAPAARLGAPTRVYLAARGLEDYRRAAGLLRELAPLAEPAWWVLLPRSYWVSPLAAGDELTALQAALTGPAAPGAALLDLELPLVRPLRFLAGAPGFARNKERLRALFAAAGARGLSLATAEYPALGPGSARLLGALGVRYPGEHLRLPMCYRSLLPGPLRRRMWAQVAREAAAAPGRVGVGLGTIARGALQREPILPPAQLAEDLSFFAAAGAATATIFRLGGLDDAYLERLRPFLTTG
ncbi:MAG: hypothetical protein AB7N76_35310 [Planctomycetota bacterium]